MKLRLMSLAFVVALLGTFLVAPLSASAQVAEDGTVTVTGKVLKERSGTKVGTYEGTISDLNFAVNRAGQLVASGTIEGVVRFDEEGKDDEVDGPTEFRQVLTTASSGTGAAGRVEVAARCSVLDLNIGRIRLDLLGLIVDIAPIDIDIIGQTGPGKLLGNLVCALVGLLDPR